MPLAAAAVIAATAPAASTRVEAKYKLYVYVRDVRGFGGFCAGQEVDGEGRREEGSLAVFKSEETRATQECVPVGKSAEMWKQKSLRTFYYWWRESRSPTRKYTNNPRPDAEDPSSATSARKAATLISPRNEMKE